MPDIAYETELQNTMHRCSPALSQVSKHHTPGWYSVHSRSRARFPTHRHAAGGGKAQHKSRSRGRKKTRNIFPTHCVAPRVTMRVAFIFSCQVVTVITDSSRKQELRQCVKFAKGGHLVELTHIRFTHSGEKNQKTKLLQLQS